MSIPARPDHDPDLVIGAALEDIDALLAHIDAQAEEIERLRRERETFHTTTYRQMDECSDGWECTAPDCDTAWTLPDGGPSHHRMRFCPGCGRRIVGEEPWRVGVDYGEDGGGDE